MARWMTILGLGALLAGTACTGARQQVAVAPVEQGGTYIDPWGTPVAWSAVPAASSSAGAAPASAEADDAKPKAEEAPPAPAPEPEPIVTSGDLGGDEDNDD